MSCLYFNYLLILLSDIICNNNECIFQPVTKETDGTEFKISSEQKESELKESTGKGNDGPLQGEYDGLKACF
jgi:hypothetical protein